LEYCHNIWYAKTRMVWLLDGEKILKICLFVFIEDRRTKTPRDGIGHAHA